MPARARGPWPPARLADRLHSAALHLLRRLRRVDEASGLSGPAASALSVLVFGGPQRMGDLARIEQVRPPTITRVVRELKARGLVRTAPDAADRRVRRVRATSTGHAVMQRGRSRRVRVLTSALGALDATEVAALERVVGALERIVRGEWSCRAGPIALRRVREP